MQQCSCPNECVAQFDAMALVKLPEEITCLPASFGIYRRTNQGRKKPGERVMLTRPCACPKFRCGNR